MNAGARAAALRAGGLIIATALLLAGLVAFLTANRVTSGGRYETYFTESVQGLEVGAPVKFRGVSVGQVTAIGLASAAYRAASGPDDRLVVVRWLIDPARIGALPGADAVRAGLRARLAPQGLTGQSYLDLDYLPPDRASPPIAVPWTPAATYVPSVPSTIGQITDAAKGVLQQLQRADLAGLAQGLAGLVTDLRGQISDGALRTDLADGHALVEQLRSTLRDADLPGLTGSLRETSDAVRGTSETLRGLARGKPTTELIRNAGLAADRFARAADQLPPLLAALQATAQRADGASADLQASLAPLLRDAMAALANLREASDSLRRDPGQILSAPPPHRSPQ